MCLHVLMCLDINFYSNVLLYHLAIARLGTPNGTGSMRATTAGPSSDKSITIQIDRQINQAQSNPLHNLYHNEPHNPPGNDAWTLYRLKRSRNTTG